MSVFGKQEDRTMAGQFLIKVIIFYGVIVVNGQSTEVEPCWERTVHSGDVLVVCRLDVDVTKSRHGISVVPSDKETKMLLLCGWNGARCPKCYSDYGVHPLGDLSDVLIVRVPADESQNDDAYKYQLVPPPDGNDPYSECEVIKTKTIPQVHTPVTQETTDEAITSTTPNVTQETIVEATAPTARTCVGGDTGNVFSLLVMAIVLLAVILASIFVVGIFVYFKFMRYMVNNADGMSNSAVENGYVCVPLKSEKAAGDAVSNPMSEKASETSSDSGLSPDVDFSFP